ncbi:MAG: ATPase [Dehalococcoidia bacterium]|nr:ATPase [Dehalococcoidia bacterium]
MAIDVTAHLTIACNRARVAALAMDPERERTWIGGIKETHVQTPLPLAVGSRVARVASFAGRRVDYVLEVVALELDALLDMQSVQAPFPMRVTYSFIDAPDGGTVAGIRIRGGSGGAMAMLGPLTACMVKRNISADLRRLKALLEAGGGATTR